MEKATWLKAWLLMAAVLGVASCGVDGAPVPPGQDNPNTIQSVDELNSSAYL